MVKHENPSVFQESMKAAGHILSTVLNNHGIGDNSMTRKSLEHRIMLQKVDKIQMGS